VDLGVTVLTSLGSGHFNDLTRSVLDDDVAVLSQSRTLHGESQRGTGLGGLEGVIIVLVRHANKKNVSHLHVKKHHGYKTYFIKG
jgi:hypothetical protein